MILWHPKRHIILGSNHKKNELIFWATCSKCFYSLLQDPLTAEVRPFTTPPPLPPPPTTLPCPTSQGVWEEGQEVVEPLTQPQIAA